MSSKIGYTILALALVAGLLLGLWWYFFIDDSVTLDECLDQGGQIVVDPDDGEEKCDLP